MFYLEYNYSEIGFRIRNERRAKEWSQEELIARLQYREAGIGRNKVSDVENGEVEALKSLSLDTLEALCDLFECDLGYLLGEYAERRRVAAEVCYTTGLSETAVQRLLNLKSDITDYTVGKVFGVVPRIDILSRILSDHEFWQILNNLSQWTSPVLEEQMSTFDAVNAYAPATDGIIAEMQPLSTPLRDTEIASVAMHFFNVAKRAVGWDTYTTGNKNTAPAKEPKR